MRFRLNPTKLRFRPFATVIEEPSPLIVKWNIMRVGKMHQIQIPVRNDSENIVSNVRVSLTVPASLEFANPEHETVRLGTIGPGDEITAVYALKAKANMKARLMGTLLYLDHRGRPRSLEISPVEHYFDADISSVEVEPRITEKEPVPSVIVQVGDQVKTKPTYGEGSIHIDRSVTTVAPAEEQLCCPNCHEPVEARWKICPYCQAQLQPTEARRR